MVADPQSTKHPLFVPTSRGLRVGAPLAQAVSMGTKTAAEIQKVGNEWFVVAPQRVGAPLRFLCESKSDAEKFLKVFSWSTR